MSEVHPTRYRVTIIEWLSHTIHVNAADTEEAESVALERFADNNEDPAFTCFDGGVDEVIVIPVKG